jgi:outer membrane biosynthesis protein TonB
MEPVAGRRDDMAGLRALLSDAQRRDPLDIEIELRQLVLQRLSAATEDDATPASGRGWRTLSDWNPFIHPRPEVATLTEPASAPALAPAPEPPLVPEPTPEPEPEPARAEIEAEAPAPQPAPVRRGISDEGFNDFVSRVALTFQALEDDAREARRRVSAPTQGGVGDEAIGQGSDVSAAVIAAFREADARVGNSR